MEQLAQGFGIVFAIGLIAMLCSFTFNRRWARKYIGFDDKEFKKKKWRRRWITIGSFIVGCIGFIGMIVVYFVQ